MDYHQNVYTHIFILDLFNACTAKRLAFYVILYDSICSTLIFTPSRKRSIIHQKRNQFHLLCYNLMDWIKISRLLYKKEERKIYEAKSLNVIIINVIRTHYDGCTMCGRSLFKGIFLSILKKGGSSIQMSIPQFSNIRTRVHSHILKNDFHNNGHFQYNFFFLQI